MPYTNNIPQGNQTIAASQPMIQANFGFIQSDLQVDHVFNGNNSPQPEGTHLQAQMRNRADPVSLPANINGIYYVSGGQAKFYNGTVNTISFSPFPIKSITGNNITIGSTFTTIATLPINSAGTVYVWDNLLPANPSNGSLNFVSNGTTAIAITGSTNSSPASFGIGITGLNLQALKGPGGLTTISFAIIYTSVA